jgi:hypothetical protein
MVADASASPNGRRERSEVSVEIFTAATINGRQS